MKNVSSGQVFTIALFTNVGPNHMPNHYHKAQPHVATLYTRDGTFQSFCDTSKWHAMCCNAVSNMLVISLPILEYLSHLLSNSQTVFSMMISIR